MARLVAAGVFFALLSIGEGSTQQAAWYWAGLAVFVLAVISDALDGYVARRQGLVTTFGRVADPFVDKVLVCGGFVYLIGISCVVQAWMVVLILAREFAITTIRGFLESRRCEFGADIWGKSKMVIQSVAVPMLLAYAAIGEPAGFLRGLAWFAIIAALSVTLLSATSYLIRAARVSAEPR
jgi:CDP-diacylglycerol--glycerol-3-phosphate 3-phosphatidyltransferase